MDWSERADVAEDQTETVALVPIPQIQAMRTVSLGFPVLENLPLGLIPSNQHLGRSVKRLINKS